MNAQGGFSSFAASLPALAANQTWVLRLRSTTATGTASARPVFAVALYPNPTAGAVRLTLAAAPATQSQAQVFDLTGRLLQTRSFSGSSYALETSGWAAGTYFVRVQSGSAVAVQRLVVE